MNIAIVIVFIVGYIGIALENPLRINKTATALFTGVLCWVFYVFGNADKQLVTEQLYGHFGEIASLLFFLLSAMTIVEIIDLHDGFELISRRIITLKKRRLLWIVGIVTFFLSAILDNLTTAIVMVSLLRKLITDKEDRMQFAGVVIIAANSGGAWSPLGDVTTTMLWIGGQITALNIIKELFLPSLVSLLVPILIFSYKMKGNLAPATITGSSVSKKPSFEQKLILLFGIGALVFVPVFKTFTHLPPFMGILLALAILWIVTELLHKRKDDPQDVVSVAQALRTIDTPSVLFFLGILVAIAALESSGQLGQLAGYMNEKIGSLPIIGLGIGLLSAIVDNVPLVAATMGMYDLSNYPTDHFLWEFIAYCAGTGGSCLIIGSAAGVAAMGIEKIDFVWYLKKISWIALLGYFAGAMVYLAENM
jgi:Na+/H+ antiporter NhaD/arsenite permease-like protein